ncbi:MAG: hypothetical protein LBS05_02170 [Tannerellaceae bacterium]|nr:hypothetical protein [Tannerellaceae bacterium]
MPQLAIAAQKVIGNSLVIQGAAAQMTLQAANPEAFAAALHPDAENGAILHLVGEYEEANFPIAGFLVDNDGTTLTGLIVNPPAQNAAFDKPLYDAGPALATVIKDNEALAILTGVQYPGFSTN